MTTYVIELTDEADGFLRKKITDPCAWIENQILTTALEAAKEAALAAVRINPDDISVVQSAKSEKKKK